MATSSSHPNQEPSQTQSPDSVTVDAVVVSSASVVPEVIPSVLDGQGARSVQVVEGDVVDATVASAQDSTKDVTDQSAASQPSESASSSPMGSSTAGGALATAVGSFSSYLAPLNKEKFTEVVREVEERLKVVQSTLSMMDSLNDSEGFDAILSEMLQSISLKTGELLNADRTTIYLLDEDKNELWSILAKDENGNSLELRFPSDKGFAGECATTS